MNIKVDILEKDNQENINIYSSLELELLNKRIALETYYDLNYNMGYLNNIREFYQLKKRNYTGHFSKKQLIELIVEYELKSENEFKVEERKRLFDNFIELKNHKFFEKFIIGNLL
tara:strand:+ start:1046 stop:1390 length:345 start_codon:yes stop_codon:yes gene_type:complete